MGVNTINISMFSGRQHGYTTRPVLAIHFFQFKKNIMEFVNNKAAQHAFQLIQRDGLLEAIENISNSIKAQEIEVKETGCLRSIYQLNYFQEILIHLK